MKSLLFKNGKLINQFNWPIINLRLKYIEKIITIDLSKVKFTSQYFENENPIVNDWLDYNPKENSYEVCHTWWFDDLKEIIRFNDFQILIKKIYNEKKDIIPVICIIEKNNIYFALYVNNENSVSILNKIEIVFYEELSNLAKYHFKK
jgi:hypothetical protein